jgi:hypothetical protein
MIMSKYTEDTFYQIHQEVEQKGLRKKFDKQLKKMRGQSKHLHKTACEMWDYALNRIKK